MKPVNLPIQKFRNIGIMAHIDAGKTTVSERILFYSGRIHAMGEVHNGNTTTDDDPLEMKKGITINSAATTVYWSKDGDTHRINLIDTPGHIDFTIEVERSLRVLDGAVCVLDGSQGVEPQTEQVWRQADKYNVTRIIFVNKMDKVGASFQMSLDSLKDKLGVRPVAVQLPAGEEDKFKGIYDLVNMKLISFDEKSLGKQYDVSEIPSSAMGEVKAARDQMIESLADVSDSIMEKFLEGNLDAISVDEIKAALRKGTISRTLYPVMCGSALRNKGVQMLLDAIIDYLPSPVDLPPVSAVSATTGETVSFKPEPGEKLSALAFKIVNDKNGDLTFIRIYSGTLTAGTAVFNSTRQQTERISKLCLMHASSKSEDIKSAGPGTIVAAVGLKHTVTGDTLCEKKSPIALEKMEFPDPVVELSVEPKTNADQDKLALGLQKMLLSDPSLKAGTNPETGQTVLKGMGELHLEIVVERLKSLHGVDVNTGKPQVSYRETITKPSQADYKYARQSGGRGQYGHVVITIAPAPRGSGLIFVNDIVGGIIPKEYIPAVEKGIKGAMDKGILAEYPIVDVEVHLVDGSYHNVDSSTNAFEIAGSLAFQQAAKSAGLVILEPIMSLEIVTPEQFMGDVIGTVSSRGGHIKDSLIRGNARVLSAHMPLRSLFGYTTELRGRTQGRAVPSAIFSHYEVCNLKLSELK